MWIALVVVLDSIPILPGFYSGIWDSWIFILSPLIGVLLGPVTGAVAVGLGTLLGHLIYFRDPYELIFMMGAPVGTLMAGLVAQRRWKPVLAIYSALLMGYFLSPVSWALPLWGIWDTLFGFCLVVLFAAVSHTKPGLFTTEESRVSIFALGLATVIGLESDVLLRVFIFVPCMTFSLFYGLTIEQLQILWLGAGVITPFKVLLAVILGLTIGQKIIDVNLREGRTGCLERRIQE